MSNGLDSDTLIGRAFKGVHPATARRYDALEAENPKNGSLCHGDSGGPLLIYEKDGTPVIIGVYSNMSAQGNFISNLFKSKDECIAADNQVWASVAEHRDWIVQMAQKLYEAHGISESFEF